MDASFKLEGFELLEQHLTQLRADLGQKALAKAGRKAFEPVLEAARALAPIESGELRDAVKISVVKPGNGDSVAVIGLKVGKGSNPGDGGAPASRRWHFTELGTVHQAAHPMFRPALDQNASKVLEVLRTELTRELLRLARRKGR